MKISRFQAIYLSAFIAIVALFFGINFQGTLDAHINMAVLVYVLTVNSLAVMVFFYLNNAEAFKENSLTELRSAYIKEAPMHVFFALILGTAIYVLQYVLNFTIYCPPGAEACVLASTKYSLITWIGVPVVVFAGVCISYILLAISFILVIYVPITMIFKKRTTQVYE